MRRVSARGAMRSPLRDRPAQLRDGASPVGAAEGGRDRNLPRWLTVERELEGCVELLPAREVERAVVAVELDPALLARLRHVEARRQTDDRPVLELDHCHPEVGGQHRERLAAGCHSLREHHASECGHATRGAEDRGQDRQRVDADVRKRPDPVERLGPWMPRLDAAPVDLGVGDPHGADRTRCQQAPGLLLRLAHEGDRRARKPDAAGVGELDERPGLGVARGERLLAVDVLARLERGGGDLGVNAVRGEVDDCVDVPVAEELLERGIVDAAEPLDELRAQAAVDVRRACDLDRRIGAERLPVRA